MERIEPAEVHSEQVSALSEALAEEWVSLAPSAGFSVEVVLECESGLSAGEGLAAAMAEVAEGHRSTSLACPGEAEPSAGRAAE